MSSDALDVSTESPQPGPGRRLSRSARIALGFDSDKIVAACVLFMVIRTLAKQAFVDAADPKGMIGVDFGQYYYTALRFMQGRSFYNPASDPLYARFQHVSSPLFPLMIMPLTHWPFAQTCRIYIAINVLLLIASCLIFCWGSRLDFFKQTSLVILVLITGFRYWPSVIELAITNMDIVLLCMVCAAYACMRSEQWVLFALVVAAAALMKTWMIALILQLVVLRRWREVGICLLALGVGAAALFTLVGWRQFPIFVAVTAAYSHQPLLVSHSVAGIAHMFF